MRGYSKKPKYLALKKQQDIQDAETESASILVPFAPPQSKFPFGMIRAFSACRLPSNDDMDFVREPVNITSSEAFPAEEQDTPDI